MVLEASVTSFSLDNGNLYYAKKNIIFKDFQKKIGLNTDEIFSIESNNDFLLIISISGKSFVLDSEKIIEVPNAQSYSMNKSQFITYGDYDFENLENSLNIFDYSLKKEIFDLKVIGKLKILGKDLFVNIKSNWIYLIRENLIIWKYSISHFPNFLDILNRETVIDIKQIIGIYKNLLWVLLGGGNLIALQIETGELTHHIKEIGKGHGDWHLDVANGIIKTLAGHRYLEFNLETLQLTNKIVISETYFFRDSNFYEGDENLYFCGINNFSKVSIPNSFGVFNTKTCQVSWFKEQQESWGLFYNPPQANDNQLAILDDKGNLLIFDKEELH